MMLTRDGAIGRDCAKEHSHDWAYGMWQDGNSTPPSALSRCTVRQGQPRFTLLVCGRLSHAADSGYRACMLIADRLLIGPGLDSCPAVCMLFLMPDGADYAVESCLLPAFLPNPAETHCACQCYEAEGDVPVAWEVTDRSTLRDGIICA